jgi:hypothetical protein
MLGQILSKIKFTSSLKALYSLLRHLEQGSPYDIIQKLPATCGYLSTRSAHFSECGDKIMWKVMGLLRMYNIVLHLP